MCRDVRGHAITAPMQRTVTFAAPAPEVFGRTRAATHSVERVISHSAALPAPGVWETPLSGTSFCTRSLNGEPKAYRALCG